MYDAAVRARGSHMACTSVLQLGVHVVVKIWPVKAYAARRPEGALYSLNPTYRKLPGDLCFNVWEALVLQFSLEFTQVDHYQCPLAQAFMLQLDD